MQKDRGQHLSMSQACVTRPSWEGLRGTHRITAVIPLRAVGQRSCPLLAGTGTEGPQHHHCLLEAN